MEQDNKQATQVQMLSMDHEFMKYEPKTEFERGVKDALMHAISEKDMHLVKPFSVAVQYLVEQNRYTVSEMWQILCGEITADAIPLIPIFMNANHESNEASLARTLVSTSQCVDWLVLE